MNKTYYKILLRLASFALRHLAVKLAADLNFQVRPSIVLDADDTIYLIDGDPEYPVRREVVNGKQSAKP